MTILFGLMLVIFLVYYFGYRPIVVNENFFSQAIKSDFKRQVPDVGTLRKHVDFLAGISPSRNVKNIASLNKAADYIFNEFKAMGYEVEEQKYIHGKNEYKNLIVKILPQQSGSDSEVIVIGAHYDVCENQPGADDNGSGVAGLLELARLLRQNSGTITRPIHLVAYTLEEPPTYDTEMMGSFIHAKSMKEADIKIKLMISLEMIGYFSDAPNSQTFPIPLLKLDYPTTGNFIALVSNLKNRSIVREVKKAMRIGTELPVFSINAPSSIPGIDFSDHRNYWKFGYENAMMLTDTSFYRNTNYHLPTDTPETLDYARMAQVVAGVFGVVNLIK